MQKKTINLEQRLRIEQTAPVNNRQISYSEVLTEWCQRVTWSRRRAITHTSICKESCTRDRATELPSKWSALKLWSYLFTKIYGSVGPYEKLSKTNGTVLISILYLVKAFKSSYDGNSFTNLFYEFALSFLCQLVVQNR